MATFKRATKQQAKLRMALIGPSGSGKTYTALRIASHLGERVAVIDTERGSASKYADKFSFDVLELDSFHPQQYIDGIKAAEAEGYDVLIIDSLSHAWMGKDGALELVDRAARRMQSQNTFAAWRDVTPLHNALVDAMLQSRLHLIVTMRAKTEYVLETNEKGKQVPRKVGLAPIQRDGLEYEFDVVADMDLDNTLIVSKSRCEALSGAVIAKPGKEVADTLKAWLSDGAPMPETPQPQPSATNGNGSRKGGDETKRHEYNAAIFAYLSEEHGMSELTYPSFIRHAIGGDPLTCDIDRLAELARYAYGAVALKNTKAREHLAQLVNDFAVAMAAPGPDPAPGEESVEQQALV